jgi:outer membrane protein OmpA-like peptidoglycan-associated protein
MMKPNDMRGVAAALMWLAFSVNPLQAADADGRWGLGLQGGAYKLLLSDHSDAWTPGWLVNADLTYGITSKVSLGVEGSWMQTYLADLSQDNKMEDGAGMSTDNINGGPRQRAYVAGLFAEYHFIANGGWSPYVVVGPGMYLWTWTDSDGNTLMSDDPALDDSRTSLDVPPQDLAGNPYELKDQELYAMAGAGVEFFPSDLLSFELGLKFRYLTHLFTSFTDDQDVVGSDPGQLDLPKGVAEAFAGLTFHFGGGCPASMSTALGNPTSGPVPMEVQFEGSVTGGCPDYTYAWDFGDGGTSTDQNPRHTYAAEGNFTASLTVTDSKGNPSQSSVAITASCAPLTATASGNPASGTAPFTVNFKGAVSGGCPPVTYTWDFGDGNTSNEQNPSHAYQAEGNYAASLTVMDSKGTTTGQQAVPIAASAQFVPTPEKPVVLEGVNFQTNKAVLLEESMQILDRVAESLIVHPDVNVEVGGHCDSDGSDAYNLKLSQRRANAVRDYLIRKGVPAAQMTAKGYGETQPVGVNKTAEGKAANRRVELKRM